MVSMVIMAILVLITVGFATLMRREQRQALDRQLSTQAFYAAEAGVNDAVAAINKSLNAVPPTPVPVIKNCNSTFLSNPPNNFNKQLDATSGVEYTCVLIEDELPNLKFNLPVGKSILVPVKANANINKLKITWQDDNGSNPPSKVVADSPNHYLPPAGKDTGEYDVLNGIGTIRATLMPVNSGGAIPDRATLANDARTFFFYPNKAGIGTTSQSYAQNGSFVDGGCDTATGQCEGEVTAINPNRTDMYLRLKAIYKPVSVTITANDGSALLSGAQVLVDSTGKANDVLRRIQVRVPITPSYQLPEFAVQSMDTICKRLNVWPGGGLTDPSDPTCGIVISVAGKAGQSTCPTGVVCGGTGPPSPTGSYHFSRTLYNDSQPPPGGIITGCERDFGDGTPVQVNVACQPGESTIHDYSASFPGGVGPYPVGCTIWKAFDVRLTEYFSNASPDTSVLTIHEPLCY
jgi:hypothetical protein